MKNRIIGLIGFVIVLFSCNTKDENLKFSETKSEIKTITVEKRYEQQKRDYISNFKKEVARNRVLLSYKLPSEEEKRTSFINGIEYCGSFSLKVNTRKNSYFVFIAITTPATHTNIYTTLSSVEPLLACSFYHENQMDSDSFHMEEISSNFMIDKKLSSILKNDSIYYSKDGYNYKTFSKVNGDFNGISRLYRNKSNENELFFENEIIPIYKGHFSDSKKDTEQSNLSIEERNKIGNFTRELLIGVLLYDCKKLDPYKVFRSQPFADFVRGYYTKKTLPVEECIKWYDGIIVD